MEPKLTKWFGPDMKPTIPGVYETLDEEKIIGFQLWKGEFWGRYGYSVDDAVRSDDGRRSMYQKVRWRGLAEKPE